MRRGVFATYTGWLILANVVAFVGGFILLGSMGEEAYSLIAIQPALILAGKGFWTFLTSMFMHAGLTHLFVNMISLMFIGSFVERLIGKKRYIIFYFVAGIIASLVFVLLAGFFGGSDLGSRLFGNPMTFAVGASGAIFGLGGLLAILTPKLKVLVMFIIPMPMWMAMVVLMFGLWIFSAAANLPIGNAAHFGGLLAGVGYGLYLKYKYPRKTAMISRYFSR